MRVRSRKQVAGAIFETSPTPMKMIQNTLFELGILAARFMYLRFDHLETKLRTGPTRPGSTPLELKEFIGPIWTVSTPLELKE
ncbi:unnamed protein product [Dovyalis caffra]|uniref:Uncharacterized protein n=1 Tax=Dovyalis caffra TaxID=77055 RepID=A0AAV1SBF2_9ROSI|nr:unnamed protein product [Dovyalis caffra]